MTPGYSLLFSAFAFNKRFWMPFKVFRHSSYRDIIEKREGLVEFNTVLSWFNDLEEFIEYHEYLSEQ